jgi:hypothetical protein
LLNSVLVPVLRTGAVILRFDAFTQVCFHFGKFLCDPFLVVTIVKVACLTQAVASRWFKSSDVKPHTLYGFHELSVIQPFKMQLYREKF